ncbi:MAG: hypothetical protein K9N46_06870 [Candidatus Marinimicrobia bacterium]|nr:hypothetical protein [Candidatus Neomarinimicrobiota bacterium]MCF7828702.1 hypothetical protein [Candidatus Neomarinimicrobiota bacterium]MCF7880443.1 hypothetical protein [Candidatus Neomarinimicrobiota bacterium]
MADSKPEVAQLQQKAAQGNETSLQSLIATYQSDEASPAVRLAALNSLADSDAPAAREAMRSVLQDLQTINLTLYIETARVLEQSGDAASGQVFLATFNNFRGKWAALRTALLDGMKATATPDMVLRMIDAYEAAKMDYVSFEENMTETLGQFDDEQVVPILMRIARDKSVSLHTRNKAIDMLAEKENPEIANLFVQMLQDPQTEIQMRDFALDASNEVQNADLLVALIESYNTGQERYFALLDALTRAMQKFTDPQLKPALSEITANKELPTNVRRQAIEAIGQYDDPTLYENLISLMRDPDNYLFYEQVYAIIHQQGTPAQMERLRRATLEAHSTQMERWRNE